MHFTERFFNLMHYILETSASTGQSCPQWSEVSQTVETLLKNEANIALPPGFTAQDHSEALCPIMLWIDECFLTSKRPDADKWYDYCLQIKYFDTNQGGELFFQRLEDLLIRRRLLFEQSPDLEQTDNNQLLVNRLSNLWIKPGQGPDPTEGLLDTFSICLVLGYQGRFFNSDPSELAALKYLAIRQLQSWRDKIPSLLQHKIRRQSLIQWAEKQWRHHGWIVLHVLAPTAIIIWIWIRSRAIIANLPF
jgi:hypothetical protein